MSNCEKPLAPFLKWVGGKRWLIASFQDSLFPSSYNTYHEPFLGGGAVFFHLAPEKAVLSDANEKLVSCYLAIQDDWKKVWTSLKSFKRQHSDEFYYKARNASYADPHKEAARFIYLNRTCFNGIYRENLKGKFNVPRGTKNNVIESGDDFEGIAAALRNAVIRHSDFGSVLKNAKEGDFAFVDPPYTVRHNMNGFVKYNQKIFSWDDQVRLRDEVQSAAARGVMCLVTNANHKSIQDLYRGIGSTKVLTRQSVVAGSSDARGRCTELAIMVGFPEVRRNSDASSKSRQRSSRQGHALQL